MSILDELPSKEMTKFPGAQSRIDEDESSRIGAMTALNCDFKEGEVSTRAGYGEVWNPAQTIQHLFNWRPYIANWLIRLHSATTIVARNLITGSDMWNLVTGLTGVNGISTAEHGSRLYIAFYNEAGYGTQQGKVWDGSDTNAVPNIETLFQGPFLNTELTISSAVATLIPADGEVPLTAGLHKICFIFTTKNGHEAGLSPATSDTVVPFDLNANGTDGYNITVTPSGNWPNWCRECRICITTIANTSRFFLMANIPAAIVPTPGASTPLVFRIWGTDQDLATFSEVTDLQSAYLQTPGGNGGTGPFNPHYIDGGGNSRMAYAATLPDLYLNYLSVVYVSDPNGPQVITADQHAIRLPGNKHITTIRWLGKSLFMFGSNYTYASLDNGDLPVLWPPPELVDGSIGSPFLHGVSANASRGYLWVADHSGLMLLRGGSYNVVPISHFFGAEEWSQINWAAPNNAFQVLDDSLERKVIVRAPLKVNDADNPQYATHLLVWDYSQVGSGIEGVNHTNVHFSKHNIRDAALGAYKPGFMELVLHPTRKRRELWMGRAETNGKIIRRKYEPADTVATIYNDDTSAGIDFQYRTPAHMFSDEIQNVVASKIRVTGAGVMTVQGKSMDGVQTSTLESIVMSAAPNQLYLRWFPKGTNTHSLTYLFTNNAVANTYAAISYIKTWYKRLVENMRG